MKRGFTLIEMLVVVAVIAILASLLAPQLRRSLDAARGVACANNQKQLYTSFAMFADDHKGCYPPGNTKYTGTRQEIDWPFFAKSSEPTWDGRWINCLGPYFGRDDWIYSKSGWGVDVKGTPANCPAATQPANTDGLNYGLSVNLGRHAWRDNVYNRCCEKMTRVTQIPHPGKSVMLADTRYYATVGPEIPSAAAYVNMETAMELDGDTNHKYNDDDKGGYRGLQAFRHQKGCNVLFADGHLKWHDNAHLEKNLTDWRNATWGAWRLPE